MHFKCHLAVRLVALSHRFLQKEMQMNLRLTVSSIFGIYYMNDAISILIWLFGNEDNLELFPLK